MARRCPRSRARGPLLSSARGCWRQRRSRRALSVCGSWRASAPRARSSGSRSARSRSASGSPSPWRCSGRGGSGRRLLGGRRFADDPRGHARRPRDARGASLDRPRADTTPRVVALSPMILVGAAALSARGRGAWAWALLLAAQVVHSLQPDAGQATALAVGGAVLLFAGAHRISMRVGVAAVLAALAAWAWGKSDPLPEVPIVEGIVGLAGRPGERGKRSRWLCSRPFLSGSGSRCGAPPPASRSGAGGVRRSWRIWRQRCSYRCSGAILCP